MAISECQLVINEFASGDNYALDDYTDDWFEIYNNGSVAVNLDGWVVMDDHSTGSQFASTGTNISAGGYIVVKADDQDGLVADDSYTYCESLGIAINRDQRHVPIVPATFNYYHRESSSPNNTPRPRRFQARLAR